MRLFTVDECIKGIEMTTDYKLTRRGRAFKAPTGPALYVFNSPGRPLPFREMCFSLQELRHAYLHGF